MKQSKMNNWQKIGVLAAAVTVLWPVTVRLVEVSKTPEELRKLSVHVDEGFKQVDSRLTQIDNRLDYFIAKQVTNSDAVGLNK